MWALLIHFLMVTEGNKAHHLSWKRGETKMRIAIGQMEPMLTDGDENLSRVKSLLKKAEESQVDVLVLPELCNSGYVFESLEEAESTAEELPSGIFSKELLSWSRKDRFVVAGICERTPEGLYNSAAVFSQGTHRITYRKIHLFRNEKDWFLAGNEEPPVVEFKGAKFGVMICFDWAFPEMTRILTLKGAHVILHPANLVLPYCQNAMVTRSIENSVFTATANRIGTERGIEFSGNSQIINTIGTRLATLSRDEIGITFVDINPQEADDKMITNRNHVIHDRRPELYKLLTKSD
jgi:predicted amidohydrolase